MRQGLAAMVACLAPAGAAGDPVPSPSAPAVVGGVPVTKAQARARAGSRAGTYEVRQTFADLVQARFVAGEAALRGLSTNPDDPALGATLTDTITGAARGDASAWGPRPGRRPRALARADDVLGDRRAADTRLVRQYDRARARLPVVQGR